MNHQCRDVSELETKTELCNISIGHQFRRRHFSAPPKTERSWSPRSYSDHTVRAEGYANLIGRAEGTGKRKARSPPAFRTDPRNKEFSASTPLLDTSMDSGGSLSVPADYLAPLSGDTPTVLISQLREASRNLPSDAVWDVMLSALAGSNEPAAQKAAADTLAVAAVTSSPTRPSHRLSTPAKGRNRKEESLSPRRGRDSTELSLLSTSTAADSTGHSSPAASTRGSEIQEASTQGRQRQQRIQRNCAAWLRQEQWKAQRRAAWVS
jgi:hypothetical protein